MNTDCCYILCFIFCFTIMDHKEFDGFLDGLEQKGVQTPVYDILHTLIDDMDDDERSAALQRCVKNAISEFVNQSDEHYKVQFKQRMVNALNGIIRIQLGEAESLPPDLDAPHPLILDEQFTDESLAADFLWRSLVEREIVSEDATFEKCKELVKRDRYRGSFQKYVVYVNRYYEF